LDLVIVLEIPEEETVRRLSARRLDPETGKIYNLITDLPPKEIDVEKLTQREDDKPEAIRKRLSLYRERTEPLIEEMKKVIKVVEIDGQRSIEEISKEIVEVVEKLK
jgi:adenylate kinase